MDSTTVQRCIEALEADMSAMGAAAVRLEELKAHAYAIDLYGRIRADAELIRELRK